MTRIDKNLEEINLDRTSSSWIQMIQMIQIRSRSISFDIACLPSVHLCPSSCCGTGISGLPMGFLAFGSWLGHVVLRHRSYFELRLETEHIRTPVRPVLFFFTFRLLLDFFTYSVKVWTIQRLDIGFSRHDHTCNLSKIPTETRWIFGVAKLSHPALAHQQKKSRSCTQRLSSFFAVAFGRISWSWNFKPSSIGWINVCKIRWATNKIKLTHGDPRQAQSGMAIATCDCLWLLVIACDCAMLNCGIAE